MHFPVSAILLPLATLISACTGGPAPPSFDSSLPQARIDAIVTAPGADPAVERALVEQLDASDGAVRMLTITSLQERTSETRGYEYGATRTEREAAVRRWVEAVNQTGSMEPGP